MVTCSRVAAPRMETVDVAATVPLARSTVLVCPPRALALAGSSGSTWAVKSHVRSTTVAALTRSRRVSENDDQAWRLSPSRTVRHPGGSTLARWGTGATGAGQNTGGSASPVAGTTGSAIRDGRP